MSSSLNVWQNVHIQTHIWGRGEVWARYDIKNNRLTPHMHKQMYARLLFFFLNEKGMGQPYSVLSCLCLTDQQHEFTWTQTKEAETRKNKLLSNQIFTFHQNQNSHSDSSGTVESDLRRTVTVMEYGSVLMCLCVWLNCCHHILECVFLVEWQWNVSLISTSPNRSIRLTELLARSSSLVVVMFLWSIACRFDCCLDNVCYFMNK